MRPVDRRISTPRGPSREFEFVCACAVGRGSAPSVGADHERIAAIARRHRVRPLVIAAYRRNRLPVPPSLVKGFDPLASLVAARETVRLGEMLSTAGVRSIVLKGSAVAMLAYGALDCREFDDIDLLVDREDAVRAAAVLGAAGYRAADPERADPARRVSRSIGIAKDAVLLHPAGHVVELHWRTSDDPLESPPQPDDIRPVELSPGVVVSALGAEAQFAYLSAHGAAHCWARMRWLADVAALLTAAPDGGEALWRAACDRGARRASASAIILCGELFGMPPPPGFRRPASLRLRSLLWMSRRAITGGGGARDLASSRWRGWAETAAKLLLVSSRGELAGWTMRLLVSPDDDCGRGGRADRLALAARRIPRLIARRRRRRFDVARRGAAPDPTGRK